MALQRTSLTKVLQLTVSAAAVVTNPTSGKIHVRGFLLHNTDSVDREVGIHWVQPSNGAVGLAASSNVIFCVAVAPKETVLLEVPFAVTLTDPNETIQAVASAAGVVNFAALGDVST